MRLPRVSHIVSGLVVTAFLAGGAWVASKYSSLSQGYLIGIAIPTTADTSPWEVAYPNCELLGACFNGGCVPSSWNLCRCSGGRKCSEQGQRCIVGTTNNLFVQCGECTNDSQCSNGKKCDLLTYKCRGVCEGMPVCATKDGVAVNSSTQIAVGGSCEVATPCCSNGTTEVTTVNPGSQLEQWSRQCTNSTCTQVAGAWKCVGSPTACFSPNTTSGDRTKPTCSLKSSETSCKENNSYGLFDSQETCSSGSAPANMVCGNGVTEKQATKRQKYSDGMAVHDDVDEQCDNGPSGSATCTSGCETISQPTAACCTGNNACSNLSSATCAGANGEWHAGKTCSTNPNPCAPPSECTQDCPNNSSCVGPDTCKCNDGYADNGQGQCVPIGAFCCFNQCGQAFVSSDLEDRNKVGTYYPGCVFWGGTAAGIAQGFGLKPGTIASGQVVPSEPAALVQCITDDSSLTTPGQFSCGDICMERNIPPDADDKTLWRADDCFDICREASFEDPMTKEDCSDYLITPSSHEKWVDESETCGSAYCSFKNDFTCNAGVFTSCAKCSGPDAVTFYKAGFCKCTQTPANCKDPSKPENCNCREEPGYGYVYHFDLQCVDMGKTNTCVFPTTGTYGGSTAGSPGLTSDTTGGADGGLPGGADSTDGAAAGTTTTGGTTGTTGGISGVKGRPGTTSGDSDVPTAGTTDTTGGTTAGTTGTTTGTTGGTTGDTTGGTTGGTIGGEPGYCCDSDKICRKREGCTGTFLACLIECSGIVFSSSSLPPDSSPSSVSSPSSLFSIPSSPSSRPSSSPSSPRSSGSTSRPSSGSSNPTSNPSSGTSSNDSDASDSSFSSGSSDTSSRSSSSRTSDRDSSRSSSRRSSSARSVFTSCEGNECGIGGSIFCEMQNMSCVQTSLLPCIKCVGSTSSVFVAGSCMGEECSLGGDIFCSMQSATCVNTANFPCIQCIPGVTSSAQSSIPTIVVLSSSSSVSSRPLIVLEVSCGNGTLDLGEECDDGNDRPGDGCSALCAREFCGNGILEPGEICDEGTENSNNPNAECRPDCTPGRCGDRIIDTPNELCDDGNIEPNDGCNSACKLERTAPQALPAQIIELPFTPELPDTTVTYIPPTTVTYTPNPPANTDTGPAALLVMIGGAAAGYAFMRRRR